MKTDDYLKHNLNDIVSIARLAPSAHNAQPWAVRLSGDSIYVSIARERSLGAGDPTSRQNIIGIGIFCEALLIAAESFGLKALAIEPNQKASEVKIRFNKDGARKNDKFVKLLHKRTTDRSKYHPVVLSPSVLQKIRGARGKLNAEVIISTDKPLIDRAASLTSKGMQLALSSPEFRNELSEFLLTPASRRKIGIPVRSMRVPSYLYFLQPRMVKHKLGMGTQVKQELARWQSASGLVFVTTDGDMPKNWFESGRTYLRVALAIEEVGLSQATSAAIVEASDFHEEIESMLGTKSRIQCVLRIGKGSAKKIHSPRLSAKEIIT